MSTTNAILMILGWAIHIVGSANAAQKAEPNGGGEKYIHEHFWECISSLLACLVLIIAAPQIPADVIDLKSWISVMGAGFGSTAMVSMLTSNFKRNGNT